MKNPTFILVCTILFVYLSGCKKEDNNPSPRQKKLYVKTKSLTHPIKPPSEYRYSYYDDWKIKSIVRTRENDTVQTVYFFFDKGRPDYKIVWDKNEGPADTISFEYSGNTYTAYWSQSGVKHKVSFFRLNDAGKPVYEEMYDAVDGQLYSTAENTWQDGNLMKTEYSYPGREVQSVASYTYFTDVYNPDMDNYSFSYGLSLNYVATIEGPGQYDKYLVKMLETVESYPLKVEFGHSTITYEYY